MKPVTWMVLAVGTLLLCGALQAARPDVVSSTVEDGQDDVDPALTEIRVQFDQPMNPHSWSIVGGGPMFPIISSKPRWTNDETIVISLGLGPNHEYWMSLNSDTFTGFRGQNGEPAVPRSLSFKTRSTGAATRPAQVLSAEQNQDAIAALRKAIDDDYSYRDRLKLDWNGLFAQYAPAMEAARTPNQFARAAVKILRHAQDAHIYVRAGDRTIGTTVNANPPNFNFQTFRRLVPNWKEHKGGVVSGVFSNGVGYLLIPEWGSTCTAGLDDAYTDVKGAKELIVDVRMNGGGDEEIARHFAGRFIDAEKMYSKDRIRQGGKWLGPFERTADPRDAGDRYHGPVAVLIGPKVASSCEPFVLMMKQNPRCKLIGEPTKGSSGRPRPHDLGNGVTVFLSSWEDQLPDGTVLEGHGVLPDVAVKTSLSELAAGDAVLDTAIKTLHE